MRIAVTRPEEDAGPLIEKLTALGHVAMTVPLLTIVPRPGVALPRRDWQAVCVTSANGIRSLRDSAGLRTVRILTVGPQSQRAAAAAGLAAEAHGGDVEGLADYIRAHLDPRDGPILYLSGAETAGNLEAQLEDAGFECHRVVLYDALPAESLGIAAESLRQHEIDAVLLYSPRSAKIWRALVEKENLGADAATATYFCLSRNVAAVLPENWETRIAQRPDETAILALLEQWP